ncbi:MAG TPA: c-type cytochrome [Burkholderiales bacterium]|nr:c-type cytochrome [Burkholderiales bacterium]
MNKSLALLAAPLLLALSGTAWSQQPAPTQNTPERAIHVCNACHGEGGSGSNPKFPKLAAQQRLYLAEQLKKFRSQARADSSPEGYMWGISALLEDETIAGLAEYYASQKAVPGKPARETLMAQGKKIFQEGIPAQQVKPCVECHGDAGQGDAQFPRIASQHADYLVKQLKLFNTKLRPHGKVMKDHIASKMNPQQMQAVAAYLQAR